MMLTSAENRHDCRAVSHRSIGGRGDRESSKPLISLNHQETISFCSDGEKRRHCYYPGQRLAVFFRPPIARPQDGSLPVPVAHYAVPP